MAQMALLLYLILLKLCVGTIIILVLNDETEAQGG